MKPMVNDLVTFYGDLYTKKTNFDFVATGGIRVSQTYRYTTLRDTDMCEPIYPSSSKCPPPSPVRARGGG